MLLAEIQLLTIFFNNVISGIFNFIQKITMQFPLHNKSDIALISCVSVIREESVNMRRRYYSYIVLFIYQFKTTIQVYIFHNSSANAKYHYEQKILTSFQ